MTTTTVEDLSPKLRYQMFKWYYENNGLYNDVSRQLFGIDTWEEDIKPIRNPVHRVVEFYPATLWAGSLPEALPIVTKNSKIVDPIQQVWAWSNWGAKKQTAARWFARDGDLFIKVAATDDMAKVFMQLIEAEYVTDFKADERGFLTMIRIDTPLVKNGKALTRTEVWDKAEMRYRVWEHDKGESEALDKLPPPIEEKAIGDFGIDFIPIVHAKFEDVGDLRGVNAFAHALDKIDEANLVASRLHEILFPEEVLALKANGMDASGRPLPPPSVSKNSDQKVEMGRKSIMRLPGNSSAEWLIPSLNFAGQLLVVQDHMRELENDLPELAYYRLKELNQVTGPAVRLMLSDAIAKAMEARGNIETALARADAMALTMGAKLNIALFKDIGTYENGDFEHSFAERDIIPMTEADKAQLMLTLASAKVPTATAARMVGWDEKRLKEMKADAEAEAELAATNFDRGIGG